MHIHITGSGAFVPENIVRNVDFSEHTFLNNDGSPLPYNSEVAAEKFLNITGIRERRYAENGITASEMGYRAALEAIANSGLNPETLDYIIVAHNFADQTHPQSQSDILPALASRIKQKLGIKNPDCVAYDLVFGCPGWLEGVVQARAFMLAGMARKCLVIGADALSRLLDPHDRDSMIYADGAGATVLEVLNHRPGGILATKTASHTLNEAGYLFLGPSYNSEIPRERLFIKMHGRKIYEFALQNVPSAMAACLKASGIGIEQIKKILIHQANEKMDEAIVNRFYKDFNLKAPDGIMPMSIHLLGNSSVATIPTLFHSLKMGKLEGHALHEGDVLIFASVGAGMNINAMVYQHSA